MRARLLFKTSGFFRLWITRFEVPISNSLWGKDIFSQHQLSAQTLLWSLYGTCVHPLTFVHMSKIPSTGWLLFQHTNTAHTRSTLWDGVRLPKWLGHWKQSHKCSVTWTKLYCHHKKRNTEEVVSTTHILHRYQKLVCNKHCYAECALQWWTKKYL